MSDNDIWTVLVDGDIAAMMEVCGYVDDDTLIDEALSAAELFLEGRHVVSYSFRPDDRSFEINTGYGGWPFERIK